MSDLHTQISEALADEPLRIVDVAELLDADHGDVREAIFDGRDSGDFHAVTVKHEGGTFQAFGLGAEPSKPKAKRTKKRGKRARKTTAGAKVHASPEAEAISLRMRVTKHEDGQYTVLVRMGGERTRIKAGKCDDAAEAGSVALSKLLG